MKKITIFSFNLLFYICSGQNPCEQIMNKNIVLESENLHLKKILSVNKPIINIKKNNIKYDIVNVMGNKNYKTISISILIETKDFNKEVAFNDIYITDLEGNRYQANLFKSSDIYPKLMLKSPYKLNITFDNVKNNPIIIKELLFTTKSNPEKNHLKETFSNLKFKYLKIFWI